MHTRPILDDASRELVAQCLELVASETVFPEWEVETLLGFAPAELVPLAEAWRRQDYGPRMMQAALSVVNNLIGYPLDSPAKVLALLGTTSSELELLLTALQTEGKALRESPSQQTEVEKYAVLWQAGTDAQEIWRALKADGKNDIDSIRILRTVSGLSLIEAKEVKVIASGASSLSAHQDGIADALRSVLEEE